jgi:L-asparagine oxygenase
MGITIYRNNNIGEIPPTPETADIGEGITPESVRLLLQYGSILGSPVSYAQEQGGRLIQNLVPVKKTESHQISTSSKVELEIHTEASFHPYRPSHVLLLCLRGDDSAITTYADDFDIVEKLSSETVDILQQNWFTTQIDESFRTEGQENMEMVTPILRPSRKSKESWKMTYDSFFMKARGVDESTQKDAERALDEFREAVNGSIKEVVLKTGDLLVINNENTIHGRKPFTPRYDGTDRWVQRMLVIDALPSIFQRQGHVITTRFGKPKK